MTNSRVQELLLQWQDAVEEGKDLPVEELCHDCPELIPEVQKRIGFLKGMQQLVQETREPRSEADESWTSVLSEPSSPPDPSPVLRVLRPKQQEDELGRLGPYRVLRLLGEGGMGAVFEVEDSQHQRLALKVLKPMLARDETARRRFLREARAAAAVTHDNVIAIREVGDDNGVPYIAMPLLVGQTLETRLRGEGQLPLPQFLDIARQVTAGLAAAHEKNLIHRDIKPGNIWLEAVGSRQDAVGRRQDAVGSEAVVGGAAGDTGQQAEGSNQPSSPSSRPTAHYPLPTAHHPLPTAYCLLPTTRVKLLDFGLARSVVGDEPVTKWGTVLGTPNYMSPEQAAGTQKLDARSDLFSLGCVFYRMVTGEPPFRGNRLMVVLDAVQRQQPKPPGELNPNLPPALSALIMRLLAKKPADRFASAREVLEALEAMTIEQSANASPAPGDVPQRLPAPRPWPTVWFLVGGVAIILLILFGVWLVWLQ